MKSIQKILILCFTILNVYSYGQDSITQKLVAYNADKFAITRPLNIEFSKITPYKYTSNHLGNKSEGRVRNAYQVETSINGNFIVKKNWMLGATFNYNYISSSTELTDQDGKKRVTDNEFFYHASALNFTYISKIFDKPVFFTASAVVDGSEKHFERVKGIATGSILLKADAKTKLAVGLVGIIDPTAQIPVFPMLTYEYKFKNGLMLDASLPKHFFLRKNLFSKGRISIGTEMDGTSFYLYDQFGTHDKYEFRQLEINSGLMYEHHLGGSFIVTLKSGIKNTPKGSSRIFKKNESFNTYLLKASPEANFYINAGLSFNPFGKLFKQ